MNSTMNNKRGLEGFSMEELEKEMKRRKAEAARDNDGKKPPPLGESNVNRQNVVTKPKAKPSKRKKTDSLKTTEEIEYNGTPPPDVFPEPGHVCSSQQWYCCLSNDTLTIIATKLGISDWKSIAELPENTQRYGAIRAKDLLLRYTLLLIPKDKCSTWKLQTLNKEAIKHQAIMDREHCVDCGKTVRFAKDLLLCDGCDSEHCLPCVGLSSLPDSDWFCHQCTLVLKARKNHIEKPLVSDLPQLPLATRRNCAKMTALLEDFLRKRRVVELANLDALHSDAKQAWEKRENDLKLQIQQEQEQLKTAKANFLSFNREAMHRHGLKGWSIRNFPTDWITLADGTKLIKREELTGSTYSARWTDYRNRVNQVCRSEPWRTLWEEKASSEKKVKASEKSLSDERTQHKAFVESKPSDRLRILKEYAALLGEPMLPTGEGKAAFARREPRPKYMGVVHLQDEADVQAMNMLREPDEVVVVVPLTASDDREPRIDTSCAIFARKDLFSTHRDDYLPRKGVREAQGRLHRLLVQNSENAAIIVRNLAIPGTVRLRTNPKSCCFDLSELVKDCDVDLDLPQEPTPKALADNGLQLRDYQQSSLRWLLDKEQEDAELGLAGEIWHRLRFLDDSRGDYYFCEITNSFALTISDHKKDLQQQSASDNRFSLPTGGILASEMGLGKTVIALALIAANPPPPHRRVLPREHTASLIKKCKHKDYAPPPVEQNKLLSNGTLIVVPMTLLSQWQAEIERFCPTLNVVILHNEKPKEQAKVQAIATADIVLASTYFLSQGNQGQNLARLRQTHFHRLLADEAHLSQGKQTMASLVSISATHRHSITGTPIGAQLSDLYGQMRYLRVAPFDRSTFWKNFIEVPFYNRDAGALADLRVFLSRLVVRHSKRQTNAGGQALIALPPRTMETVLLPFGSAEEKGVYDYLDARSRRYFIELQQVSKANVLSKYVQLMAMLTVVRQSCSHATLVSLEKLHRFNRELEERRKQKNGGGQPAEGAAQSREGLIQLAVSRARNSAKEKMRVKINCFASSGYKDVLECPVCLEIAGAFDIALLPCSHPVCSTCLTSLLDAGTTTREPSGNCPCCRDKMNRSEITYLKDFVDASDAEPGNAGNDDYKKKDEDSKPAAAVLSSVSATTNGFQLKDEVRLCTSVAEASSVRSKGSITDAELEEAIKTDRQVLYTLEEGFLRSFYGSSKKLGTKMAHLLKEIQQMMVKSTDSKCVVFSLHNGLLDLAGEELAARGIRYVRIDGTFKQHERADALLEFSNDSRTKVFLLSMRSGAIGLNLTAADHCFIMDVSPNVALEEQSIDRIHRIGQTKPVTVKRIVIEDTVEHRLLGARRSIAADEMQPETGTQLCGARSMDAELIGTQGSHSRNRYTLSDEEVEKQDEDRRRKERVEMLEKLFGCPAATVHKA